MKDNLKILFFLLLLNFSLSELEPGKSVKGKCLYVKDDYSLYDFHPLKATNKDRKK